MNPTPSQQIKAALTAILDTIDTLEIDDLELSVGTLYQMPAGRRDSKRK